MEIRKTIIAFKQELLSRERFSSITQTSQNNYSGEYSAPVLLVHQNKKAQNQISCTNCRMANPSNRCYIISDIQARKNFLRDKSKCFSCLRVAHISKNCLQNS